MKRARRRRSRGSVVIVALALIVLFSMMAASLGFRGGLEAKLARRHLDLFRERYLALAAVTAVEYLVEKDEQAEIDGPEDRWYGEPDWPDAVEFEEGVSVSVQDEEGKININFASDALLKAFFEKLDQTADLETEIDELVSSIMYWRGDSSIRGDSGLGKDYKKAPFESLDELYLIKEIDRADIPKIRPYLTVHGIGAKNLVKVNPNTAFPIVLESLVDSLPGDVSMKEDVIDGLREWRMQVEETSGNGEDTKEYGKAAEETSYFLPEDIQDMGRFSLKLNLTNVDPAMQALLAVFLGYLTTDSRFFTVYVDIQENESSKGTHIEAIVGYAAAKPQGKRVPGQGGPRRPGPVLQSEMAIISWKEF